MNITRAWLLGITTFAYINLAGCSDQDVELFMQGETFPPRAYTKLDYQGNPLANQSKTWNSNDATASEANFDRWSCVKDDETGLVFEIKTADMGLRDYRHRYTWYGSDAAKNAGDHGIGDLGVGITTYYQTEDPEVPIVAIPGSDICFDSNRCDTEKYVQDVNTAGLCGHNDWRLPTVDELALLRIGTSGFNGVFAAGMIPSDRLNDNYIDTDHFPEYNNINFYSVDYGNSFWTSSQYKNVPFDLMQYNAHWAKGVNFFGGSLNHYLKEKVMFVRLVRDSN